MFFNALRAVFLLVCGCAVVFLTVLDPSVPYAFRAAFLLVYGCRHARLKTVL